MQGIFQQITRTWASFIAPKARVLIVDDNEMNCFVALTATAAFPLITVSLSFYHRVAPLRKKKPTKTKELPLKEALEKPDEMIR